MSRFNQRRVEAEAEDRSNAPQRLQCDMRRECADPVTHIGEKGFVYCAAHVGCRQGVERCRRLRPFEMRLLESGRALWYTPMTKAETMARLGAPCATPKQPHIPVIVLTGTREHRAFLTVDGNACTVPKDAAPFIVRACNAHAAMVEALLTVRDVLDPYEGEATELGRAFAVAHAAIQQATGETK